MTPEGGRVKAQVCSFSSVWQRGDVVVVRYELRGAQRGGFGRALPLYVIEHTPEQLVTYIAEGTEIAASMLADGRGLRDVPLEERWVHPRQTVRQPWERSDVVMIFPPGRPHSLWVFHEAGRHVGWYVNLETPHRFGETTITMSDGILDLWIPTETGQAVWKDEDVFEMALKVGRLTRQEAAALRAEGERVIGERPWPTGWENWRPPEGWERPRLPPDWDTRA
jgi:hypothetical protein